MLILKTYALLIALIALAALTSRRDPPAKT